MKWTYAMQDRLYELLKKGKTITELEGRELAALELKKRRSILTR